MAVGTAELNALATELYLPRMTVNFGSQDLVLKMMRAKGPKFDGGTSIVHTALYQYNKGGAYGPGAVFNTAGEQNAKALELSWRFYNWPMTVDGTELLQVNGASKVHDLMDTKFKAATQGATEMLASHLFSGGGTDSSLIINELDHALDDVSGTLSGSTTYAGIARATNTWFVGNLSTPGGAAHGPTYNNMQTAWSKAHDGNIHPTVVAGHATAWDTFMKTQQPQQQFMSDKELAAGFRVTSFNGVPFVADNHVPVDLSTHTVNRIYFLNMDYIQFWTHTKRNMKFIPWAEPIDQDASVAHVRWAGNILVTDPRRHCVMYDFDVDDITD